MNDRNSGEGRVHDFMCYSVAGCAEEGWARVAILWATVGEGNVVVAVLLVTVQKAGTCDIKEHQQGKRG